MKLRSMVNVACFAAVFMATIFWLHASGSATGQDKKPPIEAEGEPSIWMKKKMDYSKSIL